MTDDQYNTLVEMIDKMHTNIMEMLDRILDRIDVIGTTVDNIESNMPVEGDEP